TIAALTPGPFCRKTTAAAGVAQWQSRSFPSLRRGFDSLHPLQLGALRTGLGVLGRTGDVEFGPVDRDVMRLRQIELASAVKARMPASVAADAVPLDFGRPLPNNPHHL